ncbi:MAG TPA: LysR family transcriptional regulator [Pseudonocardiaceae bacterium]|nr:LysR family transcriptional regulator [Pseudonocardiaceae bacterium]
MSDLEVRQLRYFLVVAEELHFGRAAERLGMAQPPLSRAIRELERQLDVRLLERTTRQVSLTPAGRTLLRDARTALDAVTAAAQRAQHAGRTAPNLRLAFKADYDAGLLPTILTEYSGEPAALPVDLQMGGRGEQVLALREGRADVALLPTPFDERGLDMEPLLSEPRIVALAADDPLAAHADLSLADLAARRLPDGFPADQVDATDRSADKPRRTGMDLTQIFSLIELGDTVMFLPISVTRRYPRPTIAYRTVRDLEPGTLAIAWPQECRSPAVAAFVRAALSVAAAAQSGDAFTADVGAEL